MTKGSDWWVGMLDPPDGEAAEESMRTLALCELDPTRTKVRTLCESRGRGCWDAVAAGTGRITDRLRGSALSAQASTGAGCSSACGDAACASGAV